MNWDAIAAVADILAALGVIITLLYLAKQITEQNTESQLSAARDLARDWAEGLSTISGDDKSFDLYLRAISDYESLSGGDRIKAYWMLSSALRTVELQYLHMTKGHFEPILFEGMEYRIQEVAKFPGIRQWWAGNKQQFSSEFIKYVEKATNIIEE